VILLDTNVISEPLSPAPEQRVAAWMNAQRLEILYLSAITVAELRLGVADLPAGKRKMQLDHELERTILPMFTGRVMPFDLRASEAYAQLMANAKRMGKAISKADGYIAAIAVSCGFTMATRDMSPFIAAGLSVINPWSVS
jgi:predicted nucleic acid-binding protein